MGVADWRAWTNQNGGTLPTAPNPPGTPWLTNQQFGNAGGPFGVQPIFDLINGPTSVPPYPNVPTYVPAVDPFYVGTYPTGGGWVAPMEKFIVPSPFTSGTPDRCRLARRIPWSFGSCWSDHATGHRGSDVVGHVVAGRRDYAAEYRASSREGAPKRGFRGCTP